MSQAAAAIETGISEAKLSKIERGVNGAIRINDVHAISAAYDLESHEKNHLRELAEASDSPGWYHRYDVPQEFAHFIEQQEAATRIHIYEQEFINGLFQLDGYLDDLRANRPRKGEEPDRGLRAERQENVFAKKVPPEIVYLANEGSLRRQVGGPDVMHDQIRHLLKLDERDHVSVLVVPFSAGAHPSMSGSYSILYFADDVFPTTVYLESLHEGHHQDEEDFVKHHEEAFVGTRQIAVPIKEFMNEDNELA
jgi:transcriptional regulator with XRE-family HTH domain